MPTTYTSRIADYVGSYSSYTTEIARWLQDAPKDIIRRTLIASPDKAHLFSEESEFTGNLDISDKGQILAVSRNNKPCSEIAPNLRHQSADTDSLYLATVNHPVFYRRNGLLSILPAPDSAQTGKTDIVQYPIVIDVLGTISGNFPTSHEIYIIYYVAINVLHAKMVALTTGLGSAIATLLGEANTAIDNFNTDVGNEIDDHTAGNVLAANNAITKANNYLSDWDGDGGAGEVADSVLGEDTDRDFEFMMDDEDTELAALALNGASTQLSIAQMELGKITSLLGSSANYLQVAQSYLGEATNRLNKDQLEYQWLTGQLAYVKGLYDAAFSEGT